MQEHREKQKADGSGTLWVRLTNRRKQNEETQSVPQGLSALSPNACPEHVEGLVQGAPCKNIEHREKQKAKRRDVICGANLMQNHDPMYRFPFPVSRFLAKAQM